MKQYRNKKTGEIVDVVFERLRALIPIETVAIFHENGKEIEMIECHFRAKYEEVTDAK